MISFRCPLHIYLYQIEVKKYLIYNLINLSNREFSTVLPLSHHISGYFVTSTQDLTGTETNYGVRKEETIKYQLSSTQLRTSAWRVSNIENEKLNPKAEVWCLDVEEDHSFILEGGIPTGNCCLFNISKVLKDGFEMGNVWYEEPNSLDTAFDVIGDIILSTAAQQYGLV